MNKGETGAKKCKKGKLRVDLVTTEMFEELAKVLTFGSSKYGDRNWEKGLTLCANHLAAAKRHILEWEKGVDLDHESGLSHLSHALANLGMCVTQIQRGRKDLDDRL